MGKIQNQFHLAFLSHLRMEKQNKTKKKWWWSAQQHRLTKHWDLITGLGSTSLLAPPHCISRDPGWQGNTTEITARLKKELRSLQGNPETTWETKTRTPEEVEPLAPMATTNSKQRLTPNQINKNRHPVPFTQYIDCFQLQISRRTKRQMKWCKCSIIDY